MAFEVRRRPRRLAERDLLRSSQFGVFFNISVLFVYLIVVALADPSVLVIVISLFALVLHLPFLIFAYLCAGALSFSVWGLLQVGLRSFGLPSRLIAMIAAIPTLCAAMLGAWLAGNLWYGPLSEYQTESAYRVGEFVFWTSAIVGPLIAGFVGAED